MKKYISLLLALILSLALCVPMLADEPAAGDPAPAPTNDDITVTITPNAYTNTDTTYEAYKLLDLTTALVCNEEEHEHVTACGEEPYTCGKDAHKHTDKDCYIFSYTVVDKYKGIILGILNSGKQSTDTDYIADTDKDLNEKVYNALAAMNASQIRAFANAVIEKINAANLAIEPEKKDIKQNVPAELGQGYWLIVDVTNNADLPEGATRSLAMLDTSGKESIEIKAKDELHTLTKTVNEVNSFIGDTKTYTLEYTLPSNLDQYESYFFQIKDSLDTGLAFVSTSGTYHAYVGTVNDDNEINDEDGVSFTFNGQELTIDLGTYLFTNKATVKGQKVTITYQATVEDIIGIAGNVEVNNNTATLTFTNDPHKDSKGTTSDDAVVNSYAIAIKKVNTKGEALADATFKFPFYVKAELDANQQETGYYLYAGTTAADGLTNEITTGDDGLIVVKGVKANDTQNPYYSIEETKAPAGYNKLADPVNVVAEALETTKTNTTFYIDENGAVVEEKTDTTIEVKVTLDDLAVSSVMVVNKNGLELPSTGGIGTTIFYAVGGALMAGAVILLITKKKMSNEE